jgi:DNA adenine methylase
MRVQIENRDFREILKLYDTPDTLFYLDPPYVLETRRDPDTKYTYEMTLDDHKDLVQLLLQIQGKAVLSGYQHEVYTPLEQSGWVRHDFLTGCHAAGRTRATGILGEGAALKKQPRVESVWVSPKAQYRQQLRLL